MTNQLMSKRNATERSVRGKAWRRNLEFLRFGEAEEERVLVRDLHNASSDSARSGNASNGEELTSSQVLLGGRS